MICLRTTGQKLAEMGFEPKYYDSERHNYGVGIKWSNIVSMTVKCLCLKLGWVSWKACRQQKTNLIYSAFPLYAFWLDTDGNLANWVCRILSVKMWGKKQRKWPLVQMQHVKEYARAERKTLSQRDCRKLKKLHVDLQATLCKKLPSTGNPMCLVTLAKLYTNYP